jgi:tetratricopeptide (TPR) repeat protein
MNKFFRIVAGTALSVAIVGCSSAQKMAEMAESVKVTCDPEVLEVVAEQVDANVTVTYPAKYFHPKAILEVTPVLVYDGGEAVMNPIKFQGEKVKDNYQVVPSAGATITKPVHFEYAEGMEQAHLELRGVAKYKSKSIKLPTKKVADGCNTTYMLVRGGDANAVGSVAYKADSYQEVIKQTAEGQILYKINCADVATSELKSQSIKYYQAALDEIVNNGRKTLIGTEVVAYASPDGGEELNTKLSNDRSKSADKAWNKIIKGKDVTDPTVSSVGQDWEGFQELVSKSNIEDKDLILRVLSMYSDPAVRESEIKNMSEIYTSLKSSVLPELRRARFIANVEYKNYTPEELKKLVEDNEDVLDEEALLRAASLTDDTKQKIELYNKAVSKYDSDRAQFNLGVTYLNQGDLRKAETAFNKVKANDADVQNAKGVLALRKGDNATAASYFAKAGDQQAKYNQGVLDILEGNYDKAAQELAGQGGRNEALAYILTDQLEKAEKAIHCECGSCLYMKAIIAASKGDATGVQKNLAAAYKKDASLRERAANDIEFAGYDL